VVVPKSGVESKSPSFAAEGRADISNTGSAGQDAKYKSRTLSVGESKARLGKGVGQQEKSELPPGAGDVMYAVRAPDIVS
jgi:hypothetical protein